MNFKDRSDLRAKRRKDPLGQDEVEWWLTYVLDDVLSRIDSPEQLFEWWCEKARGQLEEFVFCAKPYRPEDIGMLFVGRSFVIKGLADGSVTSGKDSEWFRKGAAYLSSLSSFMVDPIVKTNTA